jgi:pantothenate kinase
MTETVLPDWLLGKVNALLALGGRRLLGLCGAPGSGKSTLAAALKAALGEQAVVVPMDGFHLAQVELERLQRTARKGAPDTFDAAGYVALLRRLKAQPAGEIVYAPAFRREIEEPVAGAIPAFAQTLLVITEGNYLLLDGPWAPVRAELDECWFVDTDEDKRVAWLLARHMRYGRSVEAACAWIESTDAPNARLVRATRDKADFLVNIALEDKAAVPGNPLGASGDRRTQD